MKKKCTKSTMIIVKEWNENNVEKVRHNKYFSPDRRSLEFH